MKILAKTAALAAALVVVGAAVVPARAAIDVTGRHGHWTVLEGTTDAGSRVCGVATSGGSGTDRRFLGVRFFPDRLLLQVQVSKGSWSIPRGTQVPVEIEFNGFPGPWRSQRGGDGEGDTVLLNFGRDAGINFLAEFAHAGRGVVRFGGNEGAWSVNLTGSRAAINGMVECIRRLNGSARPAAPPQPFAPSSKPPPSTATDGGVPVGTGRERRT